MRFNYFVKIVFLIGIFVLMSSWNPLYLVKASKQQGLGMDKSVKEADLIIVGRVAGIIDSKPAARDRKHLEAHWVHVEQTLKGIDETGEQLAVRPNGLLWEDGKSYVIFLKKIGMGNFVEAIPLPIIEATQAHIDKVVKEVAVQGSHVSPKPVFWMQHTGGWGAGVIAELSIFTDGDFEWRKQLQSSNNTERRYEKLIGRLPNEAIVGLIHQVAKVEIGLVADDANSLNFRWLDAEGEAQLKRCYLQDHPPCAELLKTIETLALRHGQVPKTST